MRHFEGLENEQEKIRKKLNKRNNLNRLALGLFIIFTIAIMFFLLLESKKIIIPINKNVFALISSIAFLTLFITLAILDRNRLSLKQYFIHNIDYLRKVIYSEKDCDPKTIEKKIGVLISKYNFQKRKFYDFDIEKKIDDFFGDVLLHLKFYSKKDYLKYEDRQHLSSFLEIVLERILNENFILDGLSLKKPQKSIELSQLINKGVNLLKFKWVKIILLLILSFFIIYFFKLIKILDKLSLEIYFLCVTIVLIIYFNFFNNKS